MKFNKKESTAQAMILNLFGASRFVPANQNQYKEIGMDAKSIENKI